MRKSVCIGKSQEDGINTKEAIQLEPRRISGIYHTSAL